MILRKKIRVAIVEDDRLSAAAFSELMKRDPRLEVLGVADSAQAGEEMCLKHVPDVVLIDWLLGDGNGVDLIKRLAPAIPNARWLLISAYNYADLVHAAMDAGASGMIDKTAADFDVLRAAIVALADGGEYFCPVSSGFLRRVAPLIHPPLTAQEKRILKRLARYQSRSKIAQAEGISASTITEHIARIAQKFNLAGKPSADVLIPAARANGELPRLPLGSDDC